ncbi:MAG TPA: RidA family protein [Thermoplasmata archaeon]|nr:RidA family protein [Thermoplasmata archaeon]
MVATPTARLAALAIELPSPPAPIGTYSPVVVSGSTAWVSGQIVTRDGRAVCPGSVDGDVDPATARALARTAALQALSALRANLGSLDRVQRVVRLGVFVASSPGFFRQAEIANGASELLIEVFGEAGRAARVAVGVTALPLNAPVEIELAVAVA